MMEVMKIMVTSFKMFHAHTATLSDPDPAAATSDPHLCRDSCSQESLGQSLVGSLLFSPGVHKVLLVPSKSLFPQSCVSSVIKSHWPPKSNSVGILSPFARSPGWEICCGS